MRTSSTGLFSARLPLFALSLLLTMEATSQDWANLERYQEDNLAVRSRALAAGYVVFMGDSITEGWDLSEAFPGLPYLNRGISGQTTSQMLVRFRQDVLDLQPLAVVILAGTNDIAGNTGPTTLEAIVGNIASMAELARAHHLEVFLGSVLPASDYPWSPGKDLASQIPRLNTMLKAYAEANAVAYVDYFSAMTDGQNGLRPEYTTDGVHVTAEGYAVMAELARAALAKAGQD